MAHDNDDFNDPDGEYVDPDDETVTFTRSGRRRDEIPDEGVENADDTPLLTHAGTGKKNTVLYIKVIRTDGMAGDRGYKGKLSSAATMDDLARRYGNGTYDLMGCNSSHKVIAKEIDLEISMPQYDDAVSSAQPSGIEHGPGSFARANLHAMKLIGDHSEAHSETIREMATANTSQVTALAQSTVESIQTFTAAQRDADRQGHETQVNTMAQFFTAMQTQMTTAAQLASSAQAASHAQQMEMLTAMHDRARSSEQSPTELMEVLVRGMEIGRANAGEGDDPLMGALREGGNMLGQLATLANSPGAQAATRQLQEGRQTARALAAGQVRPTAPAAAPPARPASPGAAPATPNPTRKRTRSPFSRDEVRGLATLRAELRKRGVSFTEFLDQTSEHFATAPDSEVFAEGDGPPTGSDDARNESPASPEPTASVEAPAPDVDDAGGEG